MNKPACPHGLVTDRTYPLVGGCPPGCRRSEVEVCWAQLRVYEQMLELVETVQGHKHSPWLAFKMIDIARRAAEEYTRGLE